MSKIKLDTNKLLIGMYVTELDRPWSETSFLFQGFRITNKQEIEQLQNSCQFVYIDKEKSTIDIASNLIALDDNRIKIKNYSKPEVLSNIQVKHKPYHKKFEDEFPLAKTAYTNSSEKMNEVFTDIRLGNSLDVSAVKSTVQSMASSVLRNPDALKLMCVIEERDNNAVTHALHVCILTLAFAYYLGLKKDMIQQLGIGALLHDIGETKLPEGLFWKSEPFTQEEKKEVYKHTEYGVDIIKDIKGLPAVVLDIVRDHHERLNRSGFPKHAGGDEISYNAMLVSIVDVYDSVTMGYEGRSVISPADALKSMYDWRNELFQAELIEHFIQCLGIYPIGSVVKLTSGEIGIVVTFDDCSRLAPRVMVLLDKDKNYYPVPHMLDLSKFRDEDEKLVYEIKRVVNPLDYNIDIKQHILRELYTDKLVNQ
ncbi:MAG: DUF3391 domain-containing protein [Gammaproteobacteria bacterium]|nr:DUF3391 domain-containing protein [Gammaproteobacteria bacterium]MCW8987161.1 DUF3391 domain-containing protein [Gammaproteobacteria bacterium]